MAEPQHTTTEQPLDRVGSTVAAAWAGLKSLLYRPYAAASRALEPVRAPIEQLDPRIRALWIVLPVLLVLIFPQATQSTPQAFSLIGIVLFILLGTNSPLVNWDPASPPCSSC